MGIFGIGNSQASTGTPPMTGGMPQDVGQQVLGGFQNYQQANGTVQMPQTASGLQSSLIVGYNQGQQMVGQGQTVGMDAPAGTDGGATMPGEQPQAEGGIFGFLKGAVQAPFNLLGKVVEAPFKAAGWVLDLPSKALSGISNFVKKIPLVGGLLGGVLDFGAKVLGLPSKLVEGVGGAAKWVVEAPGKVLGGAVEVTGKVIEAPFKLLGL